MLVKQGAGWHATCGSTCCCVAPRRSNVGEKASHTMRMLKIMLVILVVTFPSALLAQECYCTLEDALWGNEHQSWNAVAIPALLDSLIPPGSPIVVGVPGRSVSFADGSEPCILDGLPAGGKYGPMPGDFTDAVVETSCLLPEGFPVKKQGKFDNSLLGETLALSLNVRLDPDLALLAVVDTMLTVQALPGPDGLSGTPDDSLCAECDTMTVSIPVEVLAAISDSMGIEPTVGSVLDLANQALAGDPLGVPYKYVWKAVKNLNRAFKGGRFLVGVALPPDIIPIVDVVTEEAGRSGESAGNAFLSLASARVGGGESVVSLSVAEPSDVLLSVYTVSGRIVSTIEKRVPGGGQELLDLSSGRRLPSGVYFVRAVATSAETGRTSAKTAKLVVLR